MDYVAAWRATRQRLDDLELRFGGSDRTPVRMPEYSLGAAAQIIDELEAELAKAGLGAWFHRPAHATRTHCLILRIADVARDECPFVVSASGAAAYVALQKAVDKWLAS